MISKMVVKRNNTVDLTLHYVEQLGSLLKGSQIVLVFVFDVVEGRVKGDEITEAPLHRWRYPS